MTRLRAASAVAAVLVLLLVGVGCTHPAKTLDVAATQDAVGRAVASRTKARVTDTLCPAEIRKEQGALVRCRSNLAGGVGVVRVSVRQIDDEGRLKVTVLDAIVDRAHVATDLKIHLTAAFGRRFQVACGKGRKAVRPGTTFRCTARDRSSRRAVEVTVADPAGTLRYRVLTGS